MGFLFLTGGYGIFIAKAAHLERGVWMWEVSVGEFALPRGNSLRTFQEMAGIFGTTYCRLSKNDLAAI